MTKERKYKFEHHVFTKEQLVRLALKTLKKKIRDNMQWVEPYHTIKGELILIWCEEEE